MDELRLEQWYIPAEARTFAVAVASFFHNSVPQYGLTVYKSLSLLPILCWSERTT